MNPKTKAIQSAKAPTPFQVIKKDAKTVGRGLGSILRKGASKIMAPTVRVMKQNDARMQEMDRKAKAGEFNQ